MTFFEHDGPCDPVVVSSELVARYNLNTFHGALGIRYGFSHG